MELRNRNIALSIRLNESPRPKAEKLVSDILTPLLLHSLNESPRPKAEKSVSLREEGRG